MSRSLRSQTLHALSWNFTGTMAQRVVMFVVSIVLARLLAPEQFGLIGMLTVFITVSQVFIDSGFTAALIQKKEPTQLDKCSVFYVNIAISAVVYGLIYVGSPWISAFYDEPVMTPLTRFIALQFFVFPFSLVQRSLLTKALRFKAITAANVVSSIVSGIVGVTLAYLDYGVWALATQQLTMRCLNTAFLWLASSWRPTLQFSFVALRPLFSYSSRLLASGLLGKIFENLHLLLIGKFFPAATLGFYTKARSLQRLPSQTLTQVSGAVLFPVFSSIQDDIPRMKRGVSQLLAGQALLIFPMMAGLAAVAHPFVHVLLTEKWLPCVPYLQVLCLVGALYPLHATNLSVLRATGRSDLVLRVNLMKRVLNLVTIAIALPFGVLALVFGQAVSSLLAYCLNARYTKPLISYGIAGQLKDLRPYIVMCLVMGLCTYAVGMALAMHTPAVQLVAQIATGTIIYGILACIIRPPAFRMAYNTITDRISRFSSSNKLASGCS